MPVEILTASQRTEWERFPEEIDEASLTAYFSFADDELDEIAAHRDIHGRFAIAVAVGALRWLGFVPAALEELPEPAAALIASQLDIALSSIAPARLNAERDARGEHISQAVAISAFGPCRDTDLDALRAWLADRALGHDGPLALLRSAVDRLRRDGLVRPGLTVLERIVAAARSDGEQEIHRRAAPLLTPALQDGLDELLVVSAGATAAPVKRLGQETRSVARIGESIEKLELLRALQAEDWDLEVIPANRRRMLAQYVRHATSQAIGRRDPVFRHPALLAFCAEAAARGHRRDCRSLRRRGRHPARQGSPCTGQAQARRRRQRERVRGAARRAVGDPVGSRDPRSAGPPGRVAARDSRPNRAPRPVRGRSARSRRAHSSPKRLRTDRRSAS